MAWGYLFWLIIFFLGSVTNTISSFQNHNKGFVFYLIISAILGGFVAFGIVMNIKEKIDNNRNRLNNKTRKPTTIPSVTYDNNSTIIVSDEKSTAIITKLKSPMSYIALCVTCAILAIVTVISLIFAGRAESQLWNRYQSGYNAGIAYEQQRNNLSYSNKSETSKTVYITRTGEKYHRSGCQYLRQSKIAIDKADAIDRGYTACSRCNP